MKLNRILQIARKIPLSPLEIGVGTCQAT